MEIPADRAATAGSGADLLGPPGKSSQAGGRRSMPSATPSHTVDRADIRAGGPGGAISILVFATQDTPVMPVMPPDAKRRAEQLTSLFENGTIDLQYGYTEKLGDGRGITGGRAGFTSATGDMFLVVRRYVAKVPGNNPLATYLPRLAELAKHGSANTKGLEGLRTAWLRAAHDPSFRQAQDDVVADEYYGPAMAHAKQLGITTPLGQAILYDSIIQHGDSADYSDGLPALLAKTNRLVGGCPASGIDEPMWLKAFLMVRREDLAHAIDPATRREWADSVNRVDVLRTILDTGNLCLDGPLTIATAELQATIP